MPSDGGFESSRPGVGAGIAVIGNIACFTSLSLTVCVCVCVCESESFRVLEEREREGDFENVRVTIKTVLWDFDLYDFGSQSVRLRKRYIFQIW